MLGSLKCDVAWMLSSDTGSFTLLVLDKIDVQYVVKNDWRQVVKFENVAMLSRQEDRRESATRAYSCIRPQAAGVWGLKLLVYEALTY